jgi:DNA-binding transcriptional LysR family regulator
MTQRSRRPIDGSRFPFDLRKLEVFVAVCEMGSMAGAAKTLQISQPAVSQTIAELEAALRCSLFDRDLRPIALTPAGILVRQHARSLLAEAQQILPALQRSRQAKLPLLRVGMVDSLVRSFGPSLASSMLEAVNQVSIYSGLTGSMAPGLLSRELDVVIAVDEFDDLDGVERDRLFTEPYIVIVPRAYELPASPKVTDLLQALPLIRYSARSQTGTDVDRQLRRMRVETPRLIEFDEPQGLTEMVGSGVGWAITTPLCLVGVRPDVSRIRMIPFPGPLFTRSLTLLSRDRELGQLPRMISRLAKTYLQTVCVPQMLEHSPWLEKLLRVERRSPIG